MDDKISDNEQNRELEKLLDEALDDFKPAAPLNKATNDDDLDEYLQGVDEEATRKAAENFQLMLERMVNTMQEQKQNAPNEASSSSQTIKSNKAITKSISDMIFNDASDEQELSEALSKLPLSKGSLDDLMDSIIQTAVSKEAMYPAIKDLYEKFGPYIEEKKDSLDSETLHRYKEQYRILGLLLQQYNEEAVSESEKEIVASKIANLWMQMQKHGLPPQELANDLHSASNQQEEKMMNDCVIM